MNLRKFRFAFIIYGLFDLLIGYAGFFALTTATAAAQGFTGGPVSGGVYTAARYYYGGPGPNYPGALKVAPGGGTNASGAGSLVLSIGNIALQDGSGRKIFPLAINAPITVDSGPNLETVTPTAVSCNLPDNANSCIVTATFSFVHGAGAIVASGTAGLQEAINDASANGGGIVAVDQNWAKAGGTNTILAASSLSSTFSSGAVTFGIVPGIFIEDRRALPFQYWAPRPSGVALIAAPAAPTLNVATGSLSSGAYKGTVAYVDALGGISLDSAESSATATTTGVIFTSPAAATGAVGYLPRLSTAGGSANEILAASPLTAANCTLTLLENVIPACAIGSTATITAANPSATAKPSVESNAFSTYAPQPFGSLPAPYVNNYPFGVFVATATLNSSNADGAQIGPIPAGYFNFLGHAWDICAKIGTATQVASSLLTVNFTFANEYGQSPVTVSTLAFPTQTQAAAGTAEGCVTLQTSTLGTSGKVWASTPTGSWHDFLNSAPSTQVVTADASAAQSSAINLTKNMYVAVNLQAANANNITVPIVNSVSITPRQ